MILTSESIIMLIIIKELLFYIGATVTTISTVSDFFGGRGGWGKTVKPKRRLYLEIRWAVLDN